MPDFSHLDPSKRDFKGEVQKLGFTEKQEYDLDLKFVENPEYQKVFLGTHSVTKEDINDVGFKDDNVDLAVSGNIKGTGVGDITPQMPLITIEENATYHFLFERTPQHEINHIVSYYAYFGFVWSDNPLQFSQQFFGYDGNGRPIRSTFHRDTTIEVNEDVGDFSDDGDLTLSEITFYQDVYGE
ncbi:hypothetical protein JHK82_042697 [Glycine max]|nr:hypothetical protein JHK85_043355 [Glycine max]KAG5105727.1 hypothetical protein JHK82_042697 [Glycine max]